jgi:hypothetical protein
MSWAHAIVPILLPIQKFWFTHPNGVAQIPHSHTSLGTMALYPACSVIM